MQGGGRCAWVIPCRGSDRVARRVPASAPWLGVPIAVVYKFADDQGSYLAALITYYGSSPSSPCC